MKKYVVVFDIDDALCTILSPRQVEKAKAINTECPIIDWEHTPSDVYTHIFVPYLEILFEYLINNGARIVFFSSAVEERNNTVLPQLLKNILGEERYEALKAQGQFEILSRQHLRPGNSDLGEQGNSVKDLTKVVKEGEDLLDAILVEDQPAYTAQGQWPCIKVLDCMRWHADHENHERAAYPKNTTYHLLGLFKTYFENNKYSEMPLRKGIEALCPTPTPNPEKDNFGRIQPPALFRPDDDDQFTYEIICLGLNEIRKTHPEAIVYGREYLKNNIDSFDL